MVGNASQDDLSRLRPGTIVALAALLLAWTSWKLYKVQFFFDYGFFSWQFIGATLLGVLVFLACLGAIFWAFERQPRAGQ